MGIHNNSPTLSWIKLDGITANFQGETYIVEDFKTSLQYIYWDANSPNKLFASSETLTQTASRFKVAVNVKGECHQVPNENLIMSYDGNSYLSMSEKIYGLYEKDKEFGNKFVTIETDINGIKTTVGLTTEDLNKLTEQVSGISQRADSIDLYVRELNQEFSDNKEMTELRDRVTSSIIDINAGLGIFNSKLTDAFKDNEISEDEEKEILIQIELIKEKRDTAIKEVGVIIGMLEGQGKEQEAIQLASVRDALTRQLDNLFSVILTSISDHIIVPTEVTVIFTAFAKTSDAVRVLKNTIDEMIFLGIGGTLTEELARIGIKSNEIQLSVNKTEEYIKDESASIREDVSKEVLELNTSLSDLETTMNTSFLDNILSDSEKIAIKHSVETFLNEKEDVDKNYDTIYNNPLLKDKDPIEGETPKTPKKDLLDAYVIYLEKLQSLLETIDTILAIEGVVGAEEQAQLNVSIKSYREALGAFTVALNKAIDAISEGRTHIIDEKYAEIIMSPEDGILSKVGRIETTTNEQGSRIEKTESSITQLADSITSKVDKDSYNSTISQLNNRINLAVSEDDLASANLTIDPRSVKIGFNGIDSASAEFNSDGLVIKKGGITTDALLPGTNQRIVLEPGKLPGDNNCMSIDTNYEGIRLKHNRNTYVNVLSNTIDFYSSEYSTSGSAVGKISGSQVSFNVPIYSQGSKVLTSGSYAYYGLEHNGDGNPIYRIGEYNHSHVLGCQYIRGDNSGIRLKNNTNNYGGDAILDLRGSTGSVGSASDIYFKENVRYLPFENKEVGKRFLTAFKTEIGESGKEGDILKFNGETYVNENFSLEELYNFIKNDMAICEYNYLNEHKNSINIIAQDIADTKLGSLFTEKDENGKLMFFINHNYIAIVVGALQYEMQKREKLEGKVIQLETEKVELQEQVDSMEDRLTALETKLEQLLQEK